MKSGIALFMVMALLVFGGPMAFGAEANQGQGIDAEAKTEMPLDESEHTSGGLTLTQIFTYIGTGFAIATAGVIIATDDH